MNRSILLFVVLFVVSAFARVNSSMPLSAYQGQSLEMRLRRDFNISCVPPGNAKRTPVLIATFCTNSNQGGTCVNMYDNDASWSTQGSMGSLFNALSSFTIYNTNWMIDLWTGAGFTGSEWIFRTSYPIDSMSNMGVGWNDNIESIAAVYVGAAAGATLFEDANWNGRCCYVVPGNYPSITGAALYGAGYVNNDAVSSVEFQNNGGANDYKIELYKDSNYGGGTPMYYQTTKPSFNWISVAQVTNNDWTSSAKFFQI